MNRFGTFGSVYRGPGSQIIQLTRFLVSLVDSKIGHVDTTFRQERVDLTFTLPRKPLPKTSTFPLVVTL